MLRVETTINKPDLPGLKLKKPAINLMAYFWYGLGCNSRYIETISNIEISFLKEDILRKYQDPLINQKDLEKHLNESGEVQVSNSDPDSRQLITRNNITATMLGGLHLQRQP